MIRLMSPSTGCSAPPFGALRMTPQNLPGPENAAFVAPDRTTFRSVLRDTRRRSPKVAGGSVGVLPCWEVRDPPPDAGGACQGAPHDQKSIGLHAHGKGESIRRAATSKPIVWRWQNDTSMRAWTG